MANVCLSLSGGHVFVTSSVLNAIVIIVQTLSVSLQ